MIFTKLEIKSKGVEVTYTEGDTTHKVFRLGFATKEIHELLCRCLPLISECLFGEVAGDHVQFERAIGDPNCAKAEVRDLVGKWQVIGVELFYEAGEDTSYSFTVQNGKMKCKTPAVTIFHLPKNASIVIDTLAMTCLDWVELEVGLPQLELFGEGGEPR